MVELIIGEFSGVQIDALQFALDALCPGTLLEGANFSYAAPLLKLYCNHCKNEYIGGADDLICPTCLQADFQVLQGNEMVVKAIHGKKNRNE